VGLSGTIIGETFSGYRVCWDGSICEHWHGFSALLIDWDEEPAAEAAKSDPVRQPQDGVKYLREIKPGVFVDVYDVLRAFSVVNPALQHLIKKALAVGQRGHKDAAEDLQNIYESAKRAIELEQDNA
jgi:hypothetical protein